MSILCIGQLVADVVVKPVNTLPPSGKTVLVENLQLVAGGCAANTASVLAKLGIDTAVIGVVGRDSLGESILAELAATGVDVSGVIHDADTQTSAVVVLVDQAGERSFLYRDGGNEKLQTSAIPDIALRRSDFVHIGGVMKLMNLDLAELLMRARGFGCVTSLDTDWDPRGRWLSALESALPHVDYLLTNEDEGRMLAGVDKPEDIGRKLLPRGPKAVIVKRGSLGATIITGAGVTDVPAFDVPVVDTTCAGDAFVAGFLFGLTRGWELTGAVRFANAAGALCITQISHNGITSLSATMDFLQERFGEMVVSEMFPRNIEPLGLGMEEQR